MEMVQKLFFSLSNVLIVLFLIYLKRFDAHESVMGRIKAGRANFQVVATWANFHLQILAA